MIFNKYKNHLLQSLLVSTVKIAVLKQSYVVNQDDEFFADVSGDEIEATGYTPGGQALLNKLLIETNGLFKLTADNPLWSITGTVSMKHVVFYIDSGLPETSRLLSIYTFPDLRTVINGNLTIEIPIEGILSLQ